MLFNSFHYLIFFPIVVTLYFLIPFRKKYLLLLAASYYFYMSWKPEYLALIVITTVVSFYSAKLMERHREKRKLFLTASLVIDLGILFVFKYFNFFNEVLFDPIFDGGANGFFELKVLLPVGISFYTFQTVSYLVDVYRGRIKSEDDLSYFALFVSFFPQLVAGPIERTSQLLPQLKVKHDFDYDRIMDGVGRMLLGFFKKIVIADRIAVIVDKAFNDQSGMSSIGMLLVVILFGIQIYCDFSGYSDIAVGSANVLGIKLMQNFKRPYLARSFREFWQRWHISLSTWFRDYVYIPLGGNRKGRIRNAFTLMITFILSGLWHGANLTFVIWGMAHGMLLLIERIFSKTFNRKIFWILPTFIFVNLAWVLFRAPDLESATKIYTLIFRFEGRLDIGSFGASNYQLLVLAASVVLLAAYSLLKEKGVELLRHRGIYIFALFLIIFFGYFSNQEFIYFRF